MLIQKAAAGLLIVSVVACAPRYRKEMVGSTQAAVGASQASGVAIAGEGLHRLTLVVAMPRAMQVDYRLRCPGAERTGRVGESFETYKRRRLAELERERQNQKRAAGAIAGAILGGVAGGAAVETPAASVGVEGAVDGEAVGEAVADAAIAEPQLPPGDVGAGVIEHTVEMRLAAGGACQLELAPVLAEESVAGLRGSLSVERLIDIRAEKKALRLAINSSAMDARASVRATLIERGADPHKRARERAAARARAELEARRQAEIRWKAEAAARAEAALEARRQAEVRWKAEAEERARVAAERRVELEIQYAEARRVRLERDAALSIRGRVTAWLTECGGDPHYRARLEQERRRRARLTVELSIDARKRLRARLLALGADPMWRQKRDEAELRDFEARSRARVAARRAAEQAFRAQTRAALEARASIKLALLAGGAVERPPMPVARIEQPGEPPFSGAVWVDGGWRWSGGSWVWLAGAWAAPPEEKAVWVAPTQIEIGGVIVVRPGAWIGRSGKRVKKRKTSRKRTRRRY